MPTTRPFAYNTGSTISGTVQYGNIVVGVDPNINYAGGGGNVRWWNGPDEDLGYVITYPNSLGNQPNPDSDDAYLGFKRSATKTENSFLQLTNGTYSQSFTTGTDAKEWLNNNGYWTSYLGIITSGLIIELDAYDSLSYSGTGTSVFNLQGASYTHTLTNATYTVLNGIKCFNCTTGSNRVVVDGTGPTLPTTGYTYITWARLEPISPAGFRTLLYTNSPKYTPITIPNDSNTLGYWDTAFRSSGYDAVSSVGVWVQYTVVGDSSSQTFYINGTQVGNTISYGAGGRTHWGWGNNDGAQQPWGYVANMYLYNRKLSITEIQEQYDFLSPRFIETPPVLTNLVLYYDPINSSSYPGSGTNITDLSGNGRNGTLSATTFTSPYFTYNGTNSTTFTADNSLLEPGSGDFTVEIWVNHSVISGSSRVLIAKTDSGLASGWGYGIRTTTNGNTYLEVGNGTTSTNSPGFILSANTWYQVVGVWTNVASNSIELYINGVSKGSNSHTFTSVKNTTSPLYIGSFNGGQFSQWLNGRVGVVRLYNSALTSSQVLQNFNSDKSKYGL